MKKIASDTIQVFFSNFIQLLAGVLGGFLLPKIMGITDFGLYKTFTLYATYVGLFQIGFLDGLNIKYGGYSYEMLDKREFSLYFKYFSIIQVFSSIIILAITFIFAPTEYRFVFVCIAIYLVFLNILAFFQMVSKITLRFKELATRNLLQSIMMVLVVVILYGYYKFADELISYKIYVIALLAINGILTIWYAFTFKDIVFQRGKSYEIPNGGIITLLKSGIPVMIAYLCSTLILTIDRQFVNVLFDVNTYAVYAFAYTMLALITTAMSAVSTVIYPNLKRIDPDKLTQKYTYLVTLFLVISFGCLIVYFPMCCFINWFLPQYLGSLQIFRIVLPSIVVSSAITIVMQNYYITLNKGIAFFRKTIIALLLAFITNTIAYLLFKSTSAISFASVIVMVIWYLINEQYFVKQYKVKWKKNFLYVLINICLFYLTSIVSIWWIALLIFTFVYCLITWLFFSREIINTIKKSENDL